MDGMSEKYKGRTQTQMTKAQFMQFKYLLRAGITLCFKKNDNISVFINLK